MEVNFKSESPYFEIEKDGRKPNTIRVENPKDERFQNLRFGHVERIKIVHVKNPKKFFIREITDISFWNGLCIISWKHQEDSEQENIQEQVKETLRNPKEEARA